MSAHTRVSGTWRNITDIYTRVSGSWRNVAVGYVRVSGNWQVFFYNPTIDLGTSLSNVSSNLSGTVNSGFRFNTNGTYDAYNPTGTTLVAAGNWADPAVGNVGDDYEIMVTAISGSLDTGTTGAWLGLDLNRTFAISQATPGTKTFTGTLSIRRASDNTVMETVSISLSAERS